MVRAEQLYCSTLSAGTVFTSCHATSASTFAPAQADVSVHTEEALCVMHTAALQASARMQTIAHRAHNAC